MENGTIPLIEVYEMMKTSTPRDELTMMRSPMVKSLKRRRPMSREDEDDEISLREVYKRIKTRRLMSSDVEEEEEDDDDDDIPFIQSAIPRKGQKIPMRKRRPISVKRMRSPLFTRSKENNLIRSLVSVYEQEEEEKKKKKMINNTTPGPIPVFESLLDSRYVEVEEESEEETLGDEDRDEDDRGYEIEINQDSITYTRVAIPQKLYYYPTQCYSVLSDEAYPVPTITKLALDRYNAIEGTDYRYVGLVKAYVSPVDGYNYTIRFKARLPDQDPIYFQAVIYQRRPTRSVSLLEVQFVHPLPMSQKICRPLS